MIFKQEARKEMQPERAKGSTESIRADGRDSPPVYEAISILAGLRAGNSVCIWTPISLSKKESGGCTEFLRRL